MVIVSSVGGCLGAVLARGRFTGKPFRRASARDESMKNTSRKNIVSIMGMISILVRLSSRCRLNCTAVLLLFRAAGGPVRIVRGVLLVVQLGQLIDERGDPLFGRGGD